MALPAGVAPMPMSSSLLLRGNMHVVAAFYLLIAAVVVDNYPQTITTIVAMEINQSNVQYA